MGEGQCNRASMWSAVKGWLFVRTLKVVHHRACCRIPIENDLGLRIVGNTMPSWLCSVNDITCSPFLHKSSYNS